ncbi:hypothetical protein Pla110_06710 [Polystyrenella longa]|uniref:Uncharacterized protein n=1 Tax=Polystyrenella longa TaxID=2528007 RepID=A0A518CID2_9PLAN|nr:hypothetical protein [Polystyrenella longa]QDU78967.1 hypothetical protein Pla110_06710 [Polystyrenella longa]
MSRKYALDSTDLVKITKGALIAGIAAILTFFAQAFGLLGDTVNIINHQYGDSNVVDGIPPVAIWWLLSIGVNLARKWFFDNMEGN